MQNVVVVVVVVRVVMVGVKWVDCGGGMMLVGVVVSWWQWKWGWW